MLSVNRTKVGFWVLVLAMGLPLVAEADRREARSGDGPECVDSSGNPIPVDNEQVVRWKTGTPNAWRSRAHVQGKVVRVFPDRNDHEHFEIQLGPDESSTLEVVFNVSFGRLPEVREGQEVSACGVYITSNRQTGPYPPSPSGAIIHWLHHNPRGKGEEDGFITIDGVAYGTKAGGGIERRPRRSRGGRQPAPADELHSEAS